MATLQNINTTNDLLEVETPTQELADQGYVPVSDKLDSATMKSAPSIDYGAYTETPPDDITKIDITPVAPLGEPQKTAQGFAEELQGLYDQTLGESAYRTEQEDAQGITEKQATQTDLEAQLKGLINEAKAIPLQIQQESIGRGRTVGGVAPIQTARLRDNAIKALTVNSLLESSRGNLTTALDLVDRAVAQKYDPIKEKIAVKLKNLELIRNSEAYTQAEREQAQKQIDIQNSILEQTKREAEEKKAIWNLATEAAKSGIVDSTTLKAIQDAKTKEGALRLMIDAGIYTNTADVNDFTLSPGQTRFDKNGNIIASVIQPDGDELDELLSPNELALFNAPAGSTMRDVMGQIPKSELTGTQKFAEEIKLGKQFESLVGDSRKASTAVGNINASLDLAKKAMVDGKSINAASQGILVAFQKLLDPTSVVRESEYARSGAGQSLWDRAKGTWQKIEQGGAGVTMEELNNFVDTANVFLKGYENTALKHAKRMQTIAERQGLDLNSILTSDMVDLIQKDSGEFTTLQDWYNTNPENLSQIQSIAESENLDEAETLQLINRMNQRSSFNTVGSDTNKATLNKVAKNEVGDKEGQCGRYVNKITGLGVGDSFQSKMAKMDNFITEPAPGMVFTMPYKDTGHCGIILDVKDGVATVKDSNWGLDEKIKIHKIPVKKMTGFAKV